MEGITRTILELTRGFLTDPDRVGELEEILASRDPVRLVTSRSLFSRPPLALIEFALDSGGIPRMRDVILETVFSQRGYLEVRGTLAAIAAYQTSQGENTLAAAMGAHGQDRSSLILPIPERGLLLSAADHAEQLAGRMRRDLRTATGGLELSTAIEPFWPDEALLGRSPDLQRPPRFGVLLDALARRRLESRPHLPGGLPTIPGFIQQCVACRQRPASIREPATGDLLCDGCLRARDFAGALGEGGTELLDEASSLESLLPYDRLDGTGHLAVIAASFDGIEPLVAELGGLDQVHLTGDIIDRALLASIVGLVERLGLRRRYLRFTLGTGALLLVVPASRALDAVRRLVEGGETQLAREAEALGGYPEIREGVGRMRLRVGLCLAPSHYQARTIAEMALALSDSARRHALRACGDPVSTIDFWVLHDGAPFQMAVDELRHQVYESRRDIRLSRRPYVFADFKKEILDLFRLFRRIPRADALEVRRQILCDPRAGDINFRHQIARSEEWRLFAMEAVGRDPSRWEGLLFRQAADGVRETSFLDLVELTEFVD